MKPARIWLAAAALGLACSNGPAWATRGDACCDIDPHHWAYQAVKDVVEKYHLMAGYPGGCPAPPARPAARVSPTPRPTPARR